MQNGRTRTKEPMRNVGMPIHKMERSDIHLTPIDPPPMHFHTPLHKGVEFGQNITLELYVISLKLLHNYTI